MSRFFGWLLSAFITASAFGELKVIETAENSAYTYQLTITPAPEPDPIFTHRLVLQDIDSMEGNAASDYYRVFEDIKGEITAAEKEFGEDEFHNWQDPQLTPLDKLRREPVRIAIEKFDLNLLERATRKRTCDWGLDIYSLKGVEYLDVPLGDYRENSRAMGQALGLRTRLAIADNRYKDALEDIRRIYRIAQDVAQTPLVVCALFASAEARNATNHATELIAQPGAPNLYWALSELPDPLVDYRPAAKLELDFGWKLAPFLRDAEHAEREPEEWNALWRSLAQSDLQQFIYDPPAILSGGELGMAALGVAGYSHAKQRLIAWGFDPGRVEKMAVGQVLAIYSARAYRRQADFVERAYYVPWPEAQKIIAELEASEQSEAIWNHPDREIYPLAAELLRGARFSRSFHEHVPRQIAALRVIEALRMHATENDGQLPAALADVTCVPVPENPATGEPFLYHLDGATAVLELPASDGLNNSARYEITVGR